MKTAKNDLHQMQLVEKPVLGGSTASAAAAGVDQAAAAGGFSQSVALPQGKPLVQLIGKDGDELPADPSPCSPPVDTAAEG